MKKIYLFLTIFLLFLTLLFGCGKEEEQKQIEGAPGSDEVAYQPTKDIEIQQYNLEERKKLATNRTPCDTLSLMEFVLNNYEEGTYLVDEDKVYTYNIPKSAVIYDRASGETYIFGVVAKSKKGERLIEVKNIVGYDASFIDLDSTELGTAFFYLTLFKCNGDNTFERVWEALIPNHGGFNKISKEAWRAKNIPYVKANFHYGQGVGHFDYNYFFIDGMLSQPHLLLTYEGINFKRTMTDANGDKYPDYIEYMYLDTGNKIEVIDTVTFIWKDTCYVNTRNPKQTRPF
ncbi:MAG: hypothetical protein STSR0008_19960 [Ignavibacterium sp.]